MSLALPLGPTLPILTIANLTLLGLVLQASHPHVPRPGSPASSPFLRWLISFGAIGIFVIAIIVLGPKQLPRALQHFNRLVLRFRKIKSAIMRELDNE